MFIIIIRLDYNKITRNKVIIQTIRKCYVDKMKVV